MYRPAARPPPLQLSRDRPARRSTLTGDGPRAVPDRARNAARAVDRDRRRPKTRSGRVTLAPRHSRARRPNDVAVIVAGVGCGFTLWKIIVPDDIGLVIFVFCRRPSESDAFAPVERGERKNEFFEIGGGRRRLPGWPGQLLQSSERLCRTVCAGRALPRAVRSRARSPMTSPSRRPLPRHPAAGPPPPSRQYCQPRRGPAEATRTGRAAVCRRCDAAALERARTGKKKKS